MNIPDVLAKMCLEGKAKYRTYAVGGSGVFTIPFPENCKQMVVIGVMWSPFVDTFDYLGSADEKMIERQIHHLKLMTGQDVHFINFRDYLTPVIIPSGANLPSFQGNTLLPLFILSSQDIVGDIYCFGTRMQNNFRSVAVDPGFNSELPSPNGYGNLIAVTDITTAFPDPPDQQGKILNLGTSRDPQTTLRDVTRNEFFDSVTGKTALIPPGNLDEGGALPFQYPLCTFGIVEIYNQSVQKSFHG